MISKNIELYNAVGSYFTYLGFYLDCSDFFRQPRAPKKFIELNNIKKFGPISFGRILPFQFVQKTSQKRQMQWE